MDLPPEDDDEEEAAELRRVEWPSRAMNTMSGGGPLPPACSGSCLLAAAANKHMDR